MNRIYLDCNATTPTDMRVLEAMTPYFATAFGNPSSPHSMAQEARRAVEDAREAIGAAIGASARSIIFTSGGTESDNMAIKGVALAHLGARGHIITSRIEHHAVLRTCEYLRDRLGFDVTFVGVDAEGRVDPAEVEAACRKDTILISIMLANNEVGVVEPLREIATAARERGIPVHTDAVQAVGKIPVDVEDLGVEFLAMSAHKFYGPKGVGALYVREGVTLDPLSHGGSHERGMRPGTENVPGIVGLAEAIRLSNDHMTGERRRLESLTARLERTIVERVPEVVVRSSSAERIPGTSNIAFRYVEGESVVLALDLEDIEVSTGSACTTDSAEPSHVLAAMGVPPNEAQGSIRFGLGRHTTDSDVDRVSDVLPGIVERLRAMSPLYRSGGRT